MFTLPLLKKHLNTPQNGATDSVTLVYYLQMKKELLSQKALDLSQDLVCQYQLSSIYQYQPIHTDTNLWFFKKINK